jgi:DNA-binding transcriptional regulator YhcF (GntR family)
MAQDRIDGNELRLTHEFLAVMLGVRRSGITTALQELERKGLIVHLRSVINITDREGLEETSNGAYFPTERQLIEPSISDQLHHCQQIEASLAFGAWEAEPRIAASFAAQRGRPGVGFPVT